MGDGPNPSLHPAEHHCSQAGAWMGLLVLVGFLGFLAGEHHSYRALNPAVERRALNSEQLGSGPPVRLAVRDASIGTNTIADIAEQVNPSVVSLDVSVAGAPGRKSPHKFRFHDGFDGLGTASGVIIRPDGYILTSSHVVRNADKIRVTLQDKRTLDAQVIGRDSFTDLALLKVKANDLPTARFGDSTKLRPGDWAIAIGSPMRLDHTVSFGIISAIGRSLADPAAKVDLIQTDAAINPGNSGGPLLNIRGEVIGINTAIRSDAQNIGFAVPISIATQVTEQLMAKGAVERGYIGIHMQDLDADLARTLGAKVQKGVLVVAVAEGSPAEMASVSSGDIIQKIDGREVENASDLRRLIQSHKPGDKIQVSLLHKGEPTLTKLTLGQMPATN